MAIEEEYKLLCEKSIDGKNVQISASGNMEETTTE